VPEVTVASLDARQQKLVENARQALALGQLDYVIAVGAELLRAAPGCLAVRRLQRIAQLRAKGAGHRLRRKTAATFVAWFTRTDADNPAAALRRAEELLALDPTSVPALRRLAAAAARLELPETAAFALAAIRELEPRNRVNLLDLGQAWLAAGQPGEALAVAEAMLAAAPADAGAQALQRQASVDQTVAQGRWESAGSFREKLRL
jgi:predicted Zn-dependent protease